MIYVTQGHEKGIGLEIFLKAFLMLGSEEKKNFTLIADKETLKETLKLSSLKASYFSKLHCIHPSPQSLPQSTTTLLEALHLLNAKDILVTLPTSKDQLIHQTRPCAGYTEFFRSYFGRSDIAMTFKGVGQDVMLITDHVALKEVTQVINEQLIVAKVDTTLEFFQKYFYNFDEVIFSGINPHVGENGILGSEDECIKRAIITLEKKHNVFFRGPYSGDTLHIHSKEGIRQLFVYMFHDQGLAPFKSRFGFVGINMSMGLPFLRLSVDHGTAFDQYGKNKGDITGILYLLKIALEVNQNVHQRNQNRQSSRP